MFKIVNNNERKTIETTRSRMYTFSMYIVLYIVIPAVPCQYHGLTDVFVVFAAKCISWNIFSVLYAAA